MLGLPPLLPLPLPLPLLLLLLLLPLLPLLLLIIIIQINQKYFGIRASYDRTSRYEVCGMTWKIEGLLPVTGETGRICYRKSLTKYGVDICGTFGEWTCRERLLW
jgi:hypothetical protein